VAGAPKRLSAGYRKRKGNRMCDVLVDAEVSGLLAVAAATIAQVLATLVSAATRTAGSAHLNRQSSANGVGTEAATQKTFLQAW
jgi:hypothetical protein